MSRNCDAERCAAPLFADRTFFPHATTLGACANAAGTLHSLDTCCASATALLLLSLLAILAVPAVEMMAGALLSSGRSSANADRPMRAAISMRSGPPGLSDEPRQSRTPWSGGGGFVRLARGASSASVKMATRVNRRSPRVRCVVTGAGLVSHFPTSQRRAITPSSPVLSRDPR